jgi:hypothetical protein
MNTLYIYYKYEVINKYYINIRVSEERMEVIIKKYVFMFDNHFWQHPLHGDSKAKPDRGINAVMSRELW